LHVSSLTALVTSQVLFEIAVFYSTIIYANAPYIQLYILDETKTKEKGTEWSKKKGYIHYFF
jgi:hypothetical protein